MDLCCVLPDSGKLSKKKPSELVEILAEEIQRGKQYLYFNYLFWNGFLCHKETTIYVKALPRARIPIIKLTLLPSSASPFGMSCDIGFENRLALENTRLVLTYALVDSRLRTMVLFIKVWTKRRKINNPYVGTLSSYGYVLMVIYYLAHVCKDPVLPFVNSIFGGYTRANPIYPIPQKLAKNTAGT